MARMQAALIILGLLAVVVGFAAGDLLIRSGRVDIWIIACLGLAVIGLVWGRARYGEC